MTKTTSIKLADILWEIDNWYQYPPGENMHPFGVETIERFITIAEIKRLKRQIRELYQGNIKDKN